jgi:Cd2+/Zn2+-exporting ATPase
VAVSLVTKLAFLVSAPFGFAPLWMAVLADTGATVVVTLNGLRLLKAPRY